MSDTISALATALAGFGVSLEEKTRLTFAPQVLKTFAGMTAGKRLVVLTKETPAALLKAYNDSSAEDRAKLGIASFIFCDAEYSKVRPHVLAPFRTRKIEHGISLAMKDADGNAYGFALIKK